MGEARRKHQRHCPALDRTITAVDCGSRRNSTIRCAADCPHNPFAMANYFHAFLDLEARLVRRLTACLREELAPHQLSELVTGMSADDATLGHALHAWHVHGRGLGRKWLAAGLFRDFNNDQRVMFECMATMRVALVEILHVIDDRSCLARDLLQPGLEPFVLADSGAAARVVRYDVRLGWIYRIPAGWRLSGTAVEFDFGLDREPPECFEVLLAHLGCPRDGRESWLLEHMPLLFEAIQATGVARSQLQFQVSDLRSFTRHYALPRHAAAALVRRLRSHPLISPEEPPPEAGALLEASLLEHEAAYDELVATVGSISVRADEVRTMAIGQPRDERLSAFLLELEPSLRQTEERIEDLGAKRLATAPEADPDLVPPEFLRDIGPLEISRHRAPLELSQSGGFLAQSYAGFADRPLAPLHGRSPREAATDPAARPALLRLMKAHVRRIDHLRRRQAADVDLNWLLEELGLDDLLQPPPPLGLDPDRNNPPHAGR